MGERTGCIAGPGFGRFGRPASRDSNHACIKIDRSVPAPRRAIVRCLCSTAAGRRAGPDRRAVPRRGRPRDRRFPRPRPSVRDHDDGFAGPALLGDDFLQQQPAGQVEPFHRLVEHQQFGLAEQGLRQGEALHHPLAEAGDGLVGTVGQPHPLEQRRDTAPENFRRKRRQLAVIFQQCGGGQVARKRLVLVHVADARQRAPLRQRAPQPQHAPAGGAAQSEQDLDQRRLAGSVRAEQREYLARLDAEADPTQGMDRSPGAQRRPIGLGNVDKFRNRMCHGYEQVHKLPQAKACGYNCCDSCSRRL